MRRISHMLTVISAGVLLSTISARSQTPNPTEPPAKPADQPAKPADQPAKPADQPAKPADQPAKPADQPAKPTETPAKQAEPAAKPQDPASKPQEPAPKPVESPAKPAEPASQPAPQTPKPADNAKPAETQSGPPVTVHGAAAATPKASDTKAISVEPKVVAPGQPVTLRWLFTGDKVVLSGGRFGNGVIVTGKTTVKDSPRQTTTYRFDAWYKIPEVGPDGKTVQKPTHVQYTARVVVAKPVHYTLATYRDPFGWQVSHLAGWKHDRERLEDPANNALVFFQQEDDSVERLTVAILPMPDVDSAQLVNKVEKSLYNNYDDVQLGEHAQVWQAGIPAILSTFTGIDHAHPDTRTESLVMAFVKDGKGYVVIGRTNAGDFDIKRPALEKMVRSFQLLDKAVVKQASR